MCDYEFPEFYQQVIRKANKTHKCCECGISISPGDKYQIASGKWDGRVSSYKTCAECANVRDWLAKKIGCTIIFGGMMEELINSEIIDRFDKGSWFVVSEHSDQIELVGGKARLKRDTAHVIFITCDTIKT